MKNEYPTQFSRIGSVIALIASVIYFQYPFDFNEINIGQILSVVACIVVYFSIEVASFHEASDVSFGVHGDKNIVDIDAIKLNEILEFLDAKQRYVISSMEMQTYVDEEDFSGLRKFSFYVKSDVSRFRSDSIQQAYLNLSELVSEFLREYASVYTSCGDGRSTWRPSCNGYVSDKRYAEVKNSLSSLNDKLDAISLSFENLMNVAHLELKNSTVIIRSNNNYSR